MRCKDTGFHGPNRHVSAKTPGTSSFAPVASAITYEPFGPVVALTNSNGVNETSAFDLDYRLTTLSDQGTALVQKLVYGYDHANNVVSIADKVSAANSQTFAYDHLNRLTSASGAYGSQTWTYDPAGNRISQVASGVTTTYGYAVGSNRGASITTGTTKETVGTSAAGNIASFSPAFGSVTSLTYNQANRLATTKAVASQLTQYTYDAFGERIVKVGSATATTVSQYDQRGASARADRRIGREYRRLRLRLDFWLVGRLRPYGVLRHRDSSLQNCNCVLGVYLARNCRAKPAFRYAKVFRRGGLNFVNAGGTCSL